MEITHFVYRSIKPFWASIAFLLLVALAAGADAAIHPYMIKLILDQLTSPDVNTAFTQVVSLSVTFLIWIAFVVVLYRGYDYCLFKLGPRLKQNITLSLVEHVLGHDHTFFQNNFSGSLMNKINDVTTGVYELLLLFCEDLLSRLLVLVFVITTLYYTNVTFGLLGMTWALTLALLAIFCGKKGQELSNKASEKNTLLTGKLVDVLSNIMSVRLFARKEEEMKNTRNWTEERVHAEQTRGWYFLKIWSFQSVSFLLVEGLSLYLLIEGWKNKQITIGDFTLILALNGAISGHMWNFSKDFSQFIEHLGRTIQGLDTLTQTQKITDIPQARPLDLSRGKIEFQNVKFHYKDPIPLFTNLNITLMPGEKVGLVGCSGSGKSTFVNLILRLFDIQEGRVLIDDQDIKEISQESLRSHIALIPQDPALFNRTLAENICYAKPEASFEEVIEAAKLAHAHDFIMSFEKGYQTEVGERGSKISGGQRQRIAIARAILKNAPILLLDEATSALDSLTEALIQESLLSLMQNCTTLVVAHRLSTLLCMDRILVFHRGKIVQDGSHGTLLKEEGLYRTLWTAQVGGFLPDQLNKKA